MILDELFVAYMQGPMSENFSKFFTPKSEFSRQAKAKQWFGNLKKRATENEESYRDIPRLLNDGKTVPAAKLKEHVMNNFVNSIKGKVTSGMCHTF